MNKELLGTGHPEEEVLQKLTSPPKKLSGITQLFEKAWRIYCQKIKTLTGIMVVPIGLYFLTDFVLGRQEWSIALFIIAITFILAAIFFWLLTTPALFFSIKDNLGPIESYKKGLKIMPSYLWVFFLVSLITLGGLLLLIIPGFIFSVWFYFSTYVLIFEGKRGKEALSRSKQLVSGNFWQILWRLFGLGAIIFIVTLSLNFLFRVLGGGMAIDVFSSILELFFTPFSALYGILIYKELVGIKEDLPQTPLREKQF